MQFGRVVWWVLLVSLELLLNCNALNENKELNPKDRSAGVSTYSAFGDDIYLDDQDGLEGSGRGGGEVRDDLEASGSGLGPDDEDGEGGSEFNNHNKVDPISNVPGEPKVPYGEDTIYKNKETNIDAVNRPDSDVDEIEPVTNENDHDEEPDNTVYIMNPKHQDRTSSFLAQPGVLAAVIGGAIVGLLCAILVVMFIVYRMRKKDEGSYALDEPRRAPAVPAFPKPGVPHQNREFYA